VQLAGGGVQKKDEWILRFGVVANSADSRDHIQPQKDSERGRTHPLAQMEEEKEAVGRPLYEECAPPLLRSSSSFSWCRFNTEKT